MTRKKVTGTHSSAPVRAWHHRDSANGNRATFGGTRTDGTDQAWGLEAAYMIGPFSVQGEYLTRTVDAMEGFEPRSHRLQRPAGVHPHR